MTVFIEGQDRPQATLFPDQPDDYISDDSLVRVIDHFVERMELGADVADLPADARLLFINA